MGKLAFERIGPSGTSEREYEKHWTGGPISGARFLVELVGSNSNIQAAFQSVSGIGWTRETKLHRSSAEDLNWYHNWGGKVTYSDVTLSKGVIGDSIFLRWVLGSVPPKSGKGRKTLMFHDTEHQTDDAFKDKDAKSFFAYEDKNAYDNISEESKVVETSRDMRKDIIIKAYDIMGNLRVKWLLCNCSPKGYKVSNFNAESDALLVETITLCVCGVQRFSEKQKDLPTAIPRLG